MFAEWVYYLCGGAFGLGSGLLIGDCDTPGRIYQCTRAAWAVASQI